MTKKEKRDRGFLYNANYDEEIPPQQEELTGKGRFYVV